MNMLIRRRFLARTLVALAAMATIVGAGVSAASAFTYTSGDVLYVAYVSPSGPNYIVDIGPRTVFVSATTTFTLPDVIASDLNGVLGASAANIWVGLFGVLSPSTRDGIIAANGAATDFDLSTANILGAVNQIDSFGGGVASFSVAVPSGDPRAGKFASSGATGSYQSTLDASVQGSLGNNVAWNVETQLSNASGARITAPVNIPFYKTIRNTFTGVQSRSVIGFFKLNPDGTLTYSPDADGDFIPDDIDLCPGVSSPDNTDVDGDGHAPACDCDPTNGTVWAIPTEVPSLSFTDGTHNAWTAPANLGGTAPAYDVLRATRALTTGTAPALTCSQPDLLVLMATDAAIPPLGSAFYYLIRAGNACGEGLAGTQSSGLPLPAPACP